MATRGRKRQHDATIPAHIDQGAIPRGVYWDRTGSGRWYVFERDVDGRAKRKTIAPRDAKLSDLHRIIEQRAGVDRSALGWMLDQFHQSSKFAKLSERTRDDYDYQRSIARKYRLANGQTLAELTMARITPPVMQRIVDKIGKDTPTKANQLLRYLRRCFRWGINRGLCTANPCKGVEAATEAKRRRLPDDIAYNAVLRFARARGSYLADVMEIGYLCRLRGIETITLTDAHVTRDGLQTNRRKGSRDNLVSWTPRLRAAVDALTARRATTWKKRGTPVQIQPDQRLLVVSKSGGPLDKSSLDSTWQRMITAALRGGVITPEQRFSLHDLKRKGITDTAGTRAEKQDASGHRTEAMLDVYDQSKPVVKPARE
jgi:site-specific recombinase XerC